MATGYSKDEDIGLSSDSVVDTPCQPCSGKERSCQSTHFCVDCQEFLCHDCTEYHKVLKITRDHTMMTLEKKEKNPDAAVLDKCTEKCSVHSHKTVKYFCAYHHHLGCSVCATTEHKQCSDVKHIPSIAQYLETDEGFKDFTEKLAALEIATKDITSSIATCKEKNDMESYLKTSFQNVRIQVKNAIDNMEKEVIAKVEALNLEQTHAMIKWSSACQNVSSQVQAIQNKKKQLTTSGHKCDAYVYMKKTTAQLQNYAETLENASVKSMKLAKFKPSNLTSKPDTFGELVIENEIIDIGPILGKLAEVNLLKKKLDGPTIAKMLRLGSKVRRGKDMDMERSGSK